MRHLHALLATCTLVLGTIGLAPAVRAAPSAAPIVAPPIAYVERTLPNGLHVYAVRDSSTTQVAVQVWYGVGSKDDPAGHSGFAHLFEHLMFKATRDMPAEYIDRLVEEQGGDSNASTTDDYTYYYEVLPANHLQRVLWAEAERMNSLKVDQASFVSEREVVKEELRQDYLADPYGRLELAERAASYRVHPYMRSTGGSFGDLDAATLADVQAFHSAYYRPDNATLIVMGNFDSASLDRWIDSYFGPIARPSFPVPRVAAVEPQRRHPVSVNAFAPEVPQPAVDITWQIGAASNKDTPALQVLAAILGMGKSSRLYGDLVYRRAIAQSVEATAQANQQPGLFALVSVMAQGHSPGQGEQALLGAVARLQMQGVGGDELARAKNQLICRLLADGESLEGRGLQLGTAIMLTGDAARANGAIAAINSVGAADVRRVALKYLAAERRVTIRYQDQEGHHTAASRSHDLAMFSPNVKGAVPSRSPGAPALWDGLPKQPPLPGPAVAFAVPQVSERRLANGLRVIIARTGGGGLANVVLAVRTGSAADPAAMSGLQHFTTDLLTQGSAGRSAAQFAAAIEDLGGQVQTGTDADSSGLSVAVPRHLLEPALSLLGGTMRAPRFAPREITRLREDDTAELEGDLGDTDWVAEHAATRLAYGDSPYGRVETPVSLARINRSAIVRQFHSAFRPDNAMLILTGDVDPESGFALAQKAFGGWVAPAVPLASPAPSVPLSQGKRVVVIDLPGTGEATVVVAAPSLGREDSRYAQAEVANALLGGGFSSRLNREIRVKRSLSYGAYSDLDARRGSGLSAAMAQTREAVAADTATLITDQVQKLGAAEPAAAELDARKAWLIGNRGRDQALGDAMSSILLDQAVYDRPIDEIAGYAAAIAAVDAPTARAAAPLAFDPRRTITVVVGDSRRFLPALRRKYPDLTFIRSSRLDLGNPELTR